MHRRHNCACEDYKVSHASVLGLILLFVIIWAVVGYGAMFIHDLFGEDGIAKGFAAAWLIFGAIMGCHYSSHIVGCLIDMHRLAMSVYEEGEEADEGEDDDGDDDADEDEDY
ncbi:MAG: hypothetical protein ABIG71_04590 [Candidatus Uhrbacteria bacterium]